MNPRETWLMNNLVPEILVSINSRESYTILAENAFSLFRAADPSRNASATQWLMNCYINNQFMLEDLDGGAESKVCDTLKLFHTFRNKLPESERSLNRYKSIAALYKSVQTFIPNTDAEITLEGRALKRLEREQAREESIILREDDVATIAVPLTEFASCWWGRGTQWCTAAKKNNAFSNYTDAPLIIITLPDGERVQMYVSSDDFQFMNATDEPVTKEWMEQHWSMMESIIYWALRQNGWALKYVPEGLCSPELCMIAMQQNGQVLAYVPEAIRTPELCLVAVQQDGEALGHVPEAMLTYELCLIAVQQNGLALRHVPEALRTYELCLAAVQQSGRALQYVLEILRNPELCLAAVQQNGQALEYVPKAMRNPELFLIAVRQNGQALAYVPEAMCTPEMCLAAVQQNGEALKHVPKAMRTPELYLAAVQQNEYALEHVSEAMRTPELRLVGMQQQGLKWDSSILDNLLILHQNDIGVHP